MKTELNKFMSDKIEQQLEQEKNKPNLIVRISDIFVEYEYEFKVPNDEFSIRDVVNYIENGLDAKILSSKKTNNEELIDKQTAVNFAQHLLKDFSTQEVTLEDLNKFLEK